MATALLSYNDNGCTRAYKYLFKTNHNCTIYHPPSLDQAGNMLHYPVPCSLPLPQPPLHITQIGSHLHTKMQCGQKAWANKRLATES